MNEAQLAEVEQIVVDEPPPGDIVELAVAQNIARMVEADRERISS